VATGQQRIDQLKADYGDFQEDMRKARLIRTRPTLPVYDYKVPPLAEYQHRMVVYLTNVKNSALFADCGTGKTYGCLVAAERLIRYGLISPGKVLVCVKLATLRGWLKDCERFTSLKAVPVWSGSSYKRKDKLLAALAETADIKIVNHDGVRVLKDALEAEQFQLVIVDEATILKGFRGPRARTGAFGKALLDVSQGARRRVVMSGTPAPNEASDLWGMMRFLEPNGFLLESSWKDFKTSFMKEIFFGDPANPDTTSQFVMTKAGTAAVRDIIEPMAFRVRLRDVIRDLPPKMVMTRSLPMGADQLKHYEEMEETLMTVIDDTAVTVTVQLAMIQKLRQIAGGALIDRQEIPHFIPENPKIEMLRALVEDEIAPDEAVVIFAEYRHEIEAIAALWNKECVTLYGGNSGKQNLDNLEAFTRPDGPRIIVVHPQSGAHGITLTRARYSIFYSFDYSYEKNYQAEKRTERASQTRDMLVYYLVAEHSIDEIMLDCVRQKAEQQAQLIDGDITDVREIVWKKLGQALREKKGQRKRKGRAARAASGAPLPTPPGTGC
jgi:SNF2 family DNA or RNA helicase